MNKFAKWTTGLVVSSMLVGTTSSALASSNITVQAYDEGGVQVILQFNDLKDAEWALRYIASMEAEGIFTGYEDGTFRPNEAINRIQAIVTAVRLMGLEDEAKARVDAQLNFKDAAKIKSDYGWATGYVAVALEKGLFDSTEVELSPSQPANRLWVATLLVRALGLENEALAKMNTVLPFSDKNLIPAASVGYVSIAADKGILQGYPDHTFKPNNPVTRAEMATLLDRTNQQLPTEIKLKKKQKHMEIEGAVTAVSRNSISVKDEDGNVNKIDLTDKMLVFRASGRGSIADLSVGDQVEIKYKNGHAVLIEIKQEAEQQVEKLEGTIVSIKEMSYQPNLVKPFYHNVEETGWAYMYQVILKTEQGQKTLYVTSNTMIEVGVTANPTIRNVHVGDDVEVTTSGNLILTLTVED